MEIVLAITYVERMEETVITIVNARKATSVELTIAGVFLVSILNLTVASVQKRIFAQLKSLVVCIKEIVIIMLIVWKDLSVDSIIAKDHLVMILRSIVVMRPFLEKKIFVQQEFRVQ